jgi:hypothetical protein
MQRKHSIKEIQEEQILVKVTENINAREYLK